MSGNYVDSDGQVGAQGRRVAVVAARFNETIVRNLLQGAQAAWQERGGNDEDLFIVRVPGAFELPLVARELARDGRYDAVVALGCVIRGGTPHFEYVSGECARGLQLAALETGVPVIFGVLTVDTQEQALERAGGALGNKGYDAMLAALETADVLSKLK